MQTIQTTKVDYDGRTYEFWVDGAGLDMQVADGGSNDDMMHGTGHDLFVQVQSTYQSHGLDRALVHAGAEIVGHGETN